MEIYSIDEAFLCLDNTDDYRSHALLIRKLIKQWTGIPVSIGLSTTKTLAKCANKLAKKSPVGIFDLTIPWQQDLYLASFPVEDVWGIGRRLTKQMHQMHITTAKTLRDYDAALLRKKFSIVVEKIIYELRGRSCLSIEHVQEKKQIMCSRSFGKKVSCIEDLEEAISHYAANACVKLRKQHSLARGLLVFLQKSYLADAHHPNSKVIYLEHPTDNTSHIIAQAKHTIRQLFQSDCQYHKAGIMLLDLQPNHINQVDLFIESESDKNPLMQTIDHINESMGRNTLFFAAEGTRRSWKIQSQMRSPRHTTCWGELVIVKTD